MYIAGLVSQILLLNILVLYRKPNLEVQNKLIFHDKSSKKKKKNHIFETNYVMLKQENLPWKNRGVTFTFGYEVQTT